MTHTHNFIHTYDGIGAFGLDRETDEETIIFYLQKFSDDTLISHLVKKMSDPELEEIYNLINRLLKTHLNKREYKQLFLKKRHHE
ncbi:MAG: cytoplasmic protein [Thermodesulfobacteriota bacterium]|nr:cytoplasmic protein [Thermodesulfobacteriota bacterium]